MRRKIVFVMLVAILCTLGASSRALADAVPTLTLDPVSGAAGSTVGWGFTLANLGTDFAVVTGTDFCVGVISSPCSNSLGTYTDFAGPQFLVVGPAPESNSVTQTFDSTTMTGIGSFLINMGASDSVDGMVVLTYDLFSVDPNEANFDPTLDTVSVGNELTAAASVAVGTESVPEPGSLLLLMSGLAGALLSGGGSWRDAARGRRRSGPRYLK